MQNKKDESLAFHAQGKPGKISIFPTKKLTRENMPLAYSPWVAEPCLEIAKDNHLAYKYTSKGNMVAVISNGTAVLGLGDIGHLASKPVMEGKACLFKTFANVDSIDIEVKTKDIEEFITVVKNIGDSFGGINLEDIKAPECFEIEKRLQEELSIPVFHDDQHGTAVVTLAGIINCAKITNKNIKNLKIVINGAGAAALSIANLLKFYGIKNIIICDTKGVIYQGRQEGMNKYKEEFAVNTSFRTLADAMVGSDVFIGVSVKDVITKEMLLSMDKDPIVFAMANPNPEITPEFAKSIRDDVIIATGRGDYPNQVNNVLCFPYLFRGALDVEAIKITTEMKIIVAETLANIAQQPVSEDIKKLFPERKLTFGRDYIIPTPFDKRNFIEIASKVAEIAINSGVARKIIDIEEYKASLTEMLKDM